MWSSTFGGKVLQSATGQNQSLAPVSQLCAVRLCQLCTNSDQFTSWHFKYNKASSCNYYSYSCAKFDMFFFICSELLFANLSNYKTITLLFSCCLTTRGTRSTLHHLNHGSNSFAHPARTSKSFRWHNIHWLWEEVGWKLKRSKHWDIIYLIIPCRSFTLHGPQAVVMGLCGCCSLILKV